MNRFSLMQNYGDDLLDVRDIIKRVEELRQFKALATTVLGPELEELGALEEFLKSLRGYGGDVRWVDDWYPETLIHDNHFFEYAQHLAGLDDVTRWPFTHIDWDTAADELQQDYASAELLNETYWFR